MTITEKLYKLRNDIGLSQKEFAEKAGVSQSAVNYWENGKRQPKISQLKKLATAFKIPLYMLIDEKYDLPDITDEAWKNSAHFVSPGGYAEMIKPPGPVTVPRFESPIKLHANSDSINQKYLDDERFDSIMRKMERGSRLSPQEIQFKTAYLEKAMTKVGERFAEFYSMLNDEGKKIADEQISRAIEQVMLLTKIPEYQKKYDNQ